jgi:hypothetical protein
MTLRPRLSAGLPLSNEPVVTCGQTKRAWFPDQARRITPAKKFKKKYVIFGSLAIMDVLRTSLDPWLCAPAFGRVCSFGYFSTQPV